MKNGAKKKPATSRWFSIRMPLAVYDWIERKAEKERRSKASVVLMRLEAAMEKESR